MNDGTTGPLRRVLHRLSDGIEEVMRPNPDHAEKLRIAFSYVSRIHREDVPAPLLPQFDRLMDSLKRISVHEATIADLEDSASMLFHFHDRIDGEFIRTLEERASGLAPKAAFPVPPPGSTATECVSIRRRSGRRHPST